MLELYVNVLELGIFDCLLNTIARHQYLEMPYLALVVPCGGIGLI